LSGARVWPLQRLVGTLVAATGLAALLSLAGCGGSGQTAVPEADHAPPEPTVQPENRVDLTVYFRSGSGAYLVPTVREVPITENLPKRALELLLAGPRNSDGSDLVAPLPTSTSILSLAVDGVSAHVDLSREVLTDAHSVGAAPETEALALAALAATLTEFPTIEHVRLSVEGRTRGEVGGAEVSRFWGGWGLPEVLVRDESVIGPAHDGEGVPNLHRFSTDEQVVGSADASPAQVVAMRIRDRATHVRLVIELADSADSTASAVIPRARAHAQGGTIVVEVPGIERYAAELRPKRGSALTHAGLESLGVDVVELPGTARFTLTLREPRAFLLQALQSPSRIVLDVKKTE
jgi:predicted small lipoprotein YifL